MTTDRHHGLEVTFAGERYLALGGRAVFRPRDRALFVADLHLGKADAFRAGGLPVPSTARHDLERLGELLDTHDVAQLWILGDLIHARASWSRELDQAFTRWRDARPALGITLVRGNHDESAGDPPADWGIDVVDDPFDSDGLALCHIPGEQALPAMAGHVHPSIVVRARDGFRARLACFTVTESVFLLPAFGSFTGTHRVEPEPGARVFAVRDGVVMEVTGVVGVRR